MENVFFSKLIKDGSQDSEKKTWLYIKSKWSEMALELIIYSSDKNETYKGELSSEQLREIAADFEIPIQQFYDECLEAITAKIFGDGYLYRLENEVFKLIKRQAFEIDLLEVPLKKLSSPVQILDSAFQEVVKLKEKKDTTESRAQYEEISTKETLETLRNCLKEKEQCEKVLLRKFLMLLNSKKEEICKLKNQLESATEHNYNTNTRRQRLLSSEDDRDEYEADTQPMPVEDMDD